MEEPTFKVYFNRHKQWVSVYLWDVTPQTFSNWKAGRWGYFLAKWENPKLGFLGEVHLVKWRIREDLVIHELLHVAVEWMWANGFTITRSNEERMITFIDGLVGKFYKEFRKL